MLSADEDRPVKNSMQFQRWIIAASITVIFGAVIIHQSLMRGELALPSTYDDISYFNDGARYLLNYYDRGFNALIQDFVINSSHAPLSAGLAFVGYALFGIENWVGPAMNVVILSLFAGAFFEIARPLPTGQAVLLLVALLGSPYASLTVLVVPAGHDLQFDHRCGYTFYLVAPELDYRQARSGLCRIDLRGGTLVEANNISSNDRLIRYGLIPGLD